MAQSSVGKFCWMNSGLTALINAIKRLSQRGHQFHWPENMSWTSDANDRPFLSFLKDYVGRENSGLENPVNVIRAFIRECKEGDYRLLNVTGFCAEFFQFICMNQNMEPFFEFGQPLVATTTRSSACSVCTIEPREGEGIQPENLIELKNFGRNLTLEDMVLNHFSNVFSSEEATCRCGNGHIQIQTKYNLVTLPPALMFKIGFEQYNENTGAVIQRQRIHLGGNLRLESQTGMVRNYELISAVCHTGHTGDSGKCNKVTFKITTVVFDPYFEKKYYFKYYSKSWTL